MQVLFLRPNHYDIAILQKPTNASENFFELEKRIRNIKEALEFQQEFQEIICFK